MHSRSLDDWTHEHVFLGAHHKRNERRTWIVVGLTAAMMVAEIVGGYLFGSMALVADGWHMSTHAAALSISALAYLYARRHRHDSRFTFGTGKLGDLAGFASAIVLAMIALLIAVESAERLAEPVPIAFAQAIPVAVLGLIVNLASAWLLRDDHGHGTHAHAHGDHEHHVHDHNLRSAYLHVLADAVTSVLAIAALVIASTLGWNWIDPAVGLVGAVIIAIWSYGLIRSAGAALVDVVPDRHLTAEIREHLEVGGDRIADLHLWRIGPGHNAAVVSIVTDHPEPPSIYKERLAGLPTLSHVTIEVNRCDSASSAR